MNKLFAGLALALAIALGGCTSTAQFFASTATSLSSSSPTQVTTLAQAVQAATLVTKAADLAVNTGKLDRATLLEIKALNNALHTALGDLEAANANGKSLSYAAFQGALDAWNSYATTKGLTK